MTDHDTHAHDDHHHHGGIPMPEILPIGQRAPGAFLVGAATGATFGVLLGGLPAGLIAGSLATAIVFGLTEAGVTFDPHAASDHHGHDDHH
ncbi:MAG: hypothetical protein GYB68_19965 [Chloroflexi bacterium]|nr:hypothetical protein [Chloroflexota bacterium]